MDKKAKILIVIGALALAAALSATLFFFLKKDEGDAAYVQSVAELTGSLSGGVSSYNGLVETQQTKDIELDSSKTVLEVYVSEGDAVSEGTPLFSYDTSDAALQIEQKNLDIDLQNASIKNANDEITSLTNEMNNASADGKLAYSAQIQQLKADIASAEYTIKQAQAEITKLQNEIDNAAVTAPIAGTVSHVGSTDSSLNISEDGTQTAFMTIIAAGDFRIKGTVSELNVQDIYQDMPVIVKSRADDQSWSGKISSVNTSETEASGDGYSTGGEATNYAFYVETENTEGLMLGQHVIIEPDYGQSGREGLWLSSGFIVQEESESYVWAETNGRLEKRGVMLGEYDSETDEWQIKDGLDSSDYIAWPDAGLTEGMSTTTDYTYEDAEDESSGLDEIFQEEGETATENPDSVEETTEEATTRKSP